MSSSPPQRIGVGLAAALVLLVASCGGDDSIVTGPGPSDDLETPEEPQLSAPTSVGASVTWNEATIWWTPGEAATSHEVVVSDVSALEPDRVVTVAGDVPREVTITNLSWDATHEVVVAALNHSGRAESAPIRFETPMPESPVLTGFFSPLPATTWYYPSGGPDPSCLVVEWDLAPGAEGYRLEVRGDTDGDSFEALLPNFPGEAAFCAAAYPIVDGMSYDAQVFAVRGNEELGSNTLEWTIDFDFGYPATGTWTESLMGWGVCVYTLELVDSEGPISGSWTQVCYALDGTSSETTVSPVTGTRIGLAVELTRELPDASPQVYAGYFDGPDMLWISYYNPPGHYTMLSFERQ